MNQNIKIKADLCIITDNGRKFEYNNCIIIPIRKPNENGSDISTIKKGIKLNLEYFLDLINDPNKFSHGEKLNKEKLIKRFIALYPGDTNEEIAEQLGVAKSYVFTVRKKLAKGE